MYFIPLSLPPSPRSENETLEIWTGHRELKLAILEQKPDSLALEQYSDCKIGNNLHATATQYIYATFYHISPHPSPHPVRFAIELYI